MKAIELSESGKILLELHNAIDNKLVYIMEEATVSGDTYTMNGKKGKGTIKKASANARTRANDQLTTDLRVTIADGETLTYDTDEEETVNVTTTTYGNNGSGHREQQCRDIIQQRLWQQLWFWQQQQRW